MKRQRCNCEDMPERDKEGFLQRTGRLSRILSEDTSLPGRLGARARRRSRAGVKD